MGGVTGESGMSNKPRGKGHLLLDAGMRVRREVLLFIADAFAVLFNLQKVTAGTRTQVVAKAVVGLPKVVIPCLRGHASSAALFVA